MCKKRFFLAICLCVAAGQVALAAVPYYDWCSEYTTAPAHTLALWTFNENTITGVSPSFSALDIVFLRSAALSGWAFFGDGGKFGWGFHNVGEQYAEDRADVTPSTDLFPARTDPSISVECWIKLNDLSQQQQYIVDKAYTDKKGFKFFLYRDPVNDPCVVEPDYYLTFIVGNDVNTVNISTVLSWETDHWYHIAGTWDAATDIGKLFRDGMEVFSTTYPGMSIVNAATRALRIGNRRGSIYWALNGTIDNLRIADVAHQYAVHGPPQYCGDYGTVYLDGDISGEYGVPDCRVDFYDFAQMAASWVQCSDPTDPSCDVYWK